MLCMRVTRDRRGNVCPSVRRQLLNLNDIILVTLWLFKEELERLTVSCFTYNKLFSRIWI